MSRQALRTRRLLSLPLLWAPALLLAFLAPTLRLGALMALFFGLLLGIATDPLVRRGARPLLVALLTALVAFGLGFTGQSLALERARTALLESPPERLDDRRVLTLARMGALERPFISELSGRMFRDALRDEDGPRMFHLLREVTAHPVLTPVELRTAANFFAPTHTAAAARLHDAILAQSDDPVERTHAWRGLLTLQPARAPRLAPAILAAWEEDALLNRLSATELEAHLALLYHLGRLLDDPETWMTLHRRLGQAGALLPDSIPALLEELRHFASHEHAESIAAVDARTLTPVLDLLLEAGDAAALFRLTTPHIAGPLGRRVEPWRQAALALSPGGVPLDLEAPFPCTLIVSGRERTALPGRVTLPPGSHVFECAEQPGQRERRERRIVPNVDSLHWTLFGE